MTQIPPFQEACARLSTFLAERGYQAEPLWVFREDISFSHGTYWLRTPLPSTNEVAVRSLYEHGRTLGFGVRINAPFQSERRACCYLEIPLSVDEAQDSWSLGFVVSVADPAPEARPVSSPTYWRVRQWLNRAAPFREEIEERLPRRSGVAANEALPPNAWPGLQT